MCSWEVSRREFRRTRRGYDPAEVAAFLGQVAADLAYIHAELARSREETVRVKEALRAWQSRQARETYGLVNR